MKKLLAAGAVALVVAVTVWLGTSPHGGPGPERAAPAVGGVTASEPAASRDGAAPRALIAGEKEPDAAEATGALRVHVRFAAADRVAAGVGFEIVPALPLASLHARLARAGEDGTSLVEGLRPGEVSVRALVGGAPVRARIVAGQTTDAQVVVPAGLQVRGIVVDGAGAPIRGARVWLSRTAARDNTGGIATETADDGRFALAHVAPGRWISAFAKGCYPAPCRQVDGEPGASADVRIELAGPAGALIGSVLDERAQPVAHASVLVGFLYRDPMGSDAAFAPAFELHTDASGSFRADGVAAGATSVWARAPGYPPVLQQVRVAESGETRAEVRLQRGASLHGIVLGMDGQPGATVGIAVEDRTAPAEGMAYQGPEWAGPLAVRTDGAGRYRVEDLGAGPIRAVADAGDAGRALFDATAEPGEELSWNPILCTGGTVEGVLSETGGGALAGWAVRAQPDHGDRTLEAVTDARGAFRVEQCDARRHVLWFTAPGAWQHALVCVRGVLPGGDPLHVRVPPERIPSGFLSGELVVPAGAAMPALLEVEKLDTDLHWLQTTVDATSGRFRAGPLPAGPYRLRAESRTHGLATVGPFDLAAGQERELGAIAFALPGSLRATLHSTDGVPLSLVTAGVALWQGEWHAPRAWPSQTDGNVVTAGKLAPGRWLLQVYGADVPLHRFPFEVRAGELVELDVAFRRGVRREILITAPSAGRDVLLAWSWTRDGRLDSRYRDNWFRAGPLRSEWTLLPGRYEVAVEDEGGRSVTSEFTVDGSATAGEPIVIKLP